jgi:hypothetical protein
LWNISNYSIDLDAVFKHYIKDDDKIYINSLILLINMINNFFNVNKFSDILNILDGELIHIILSKYTIDNYPAIMPYREIFTSLSYLDSCNENAKDNIYRLFFA